jgi:hypothetical protein
LRILDDQGEVSVALFYHYSRVKSEILEPSFGRHRHGGEDPNAVNEPVVWLSNRELGSMEDADEIVEFLHIVEVDESDSNLHPERAFNDLMQAFNSEFESEREPTLEVVLL